MESLTATQVLRVTGLRKRYGGTEVVAGTNLAIARGECFGLLGPNGAGKTTTLRLCLGLVDPDGGTIELMGRSVPAEARAARERVGVVPQHDNIDPDFTVTENLLVYGRYFGIADATIRSRIPGLLEFAGLAGRADAKIQTLSGGMKRRLTLARALVNDPEVVFMDEPTTGLDPQARHLIWERLRSLVAQGKTILLTTHFMDEAERLCGRLAIMDRGRIIAQGPPRELVADAHRAAGRRGARRRRRRMGRARGVAARGESRARRRIGVLLRARRGPDRRRPRAPRRARVPPPAGEPRGRVPQAHGQGSA